MSNSVEEIKLNKIAQGIIDIESGMNWFMESDSNTQLKLLRKLYYMILQAGAKEDDISQAISLSKLKRTFTPCVLLSKGNLKIQIPKIINLPVQEYLKSFKLLISLFSVADERRRNIICKNGCNHWWHNLNDNAE